MDITRRALLGGVAAGSAASIGGGVMRASPAGATDGRPLVLHTENLRLSSAGQVSPSVGDSVLLSAGLLDAATEEAGSLFGEYRVVAEPRSVGQAAPTSIETHHFVLANGTITGSGVASRDDEPDQFTIVGGTGDYAGAHGSYAAQQSPVGLGGDGSATYTFTFSTFSNSERS